MLINILLVVLLVLGGLWLYTYTKKSEQYEPFADNLRKGPLNTNKVPPVDPKVVENIKKSMRDLIEQKPEIIEAAKEILADPEINPTFKDLMAAGPAVEKSNFGF